MSDTFQKASIGESPLLRTPSVAYGRTFRRLVDGWISDTHHVPVVCRNGPIFSGAHLADIRAGFITAAIKIALIINQLHRPASGSFSQFDGKPDKAVGIGQPG